MPPEGKLLASGSPLHQFLAAKLGNRAAIAGGGQEAVVLLGGQAGHGLEQVGEVGRPVLDGPVLHGAGDGVGDGRVGQLRALLDGLLKRLEDGLGQPLLLDFFAEHQRTEQFLEVCGAEVDLIQFVFGGRDRLDSSLTKIRHWERPLIEKTNSREPPGEGANGQFGLVEERILRL